MACPPAPNVDIHPGSPSARQPGLDLLRAAAIVLVVLYHGGLFGFTLPHEAQRFGWVGVDLFFVLSGYLIGGQLLDSLARGQRLNLPRFFRRRALRILPAYLVVLALYAALPVLREYPQMPPWWRFLAFVQNVGLHGGTCFSHAWSLCVEAQSYLALPFLLRWMVGWRRGGFLVAGGVILAGMILRATLAALHLTAEGEVSPRAFQTLIYYATWTRLDPLVLGVGLAALERFRPQTRARLMATASWLWLPGLGALGYALWLGEGDLTVAVCVWQFPLVALGMAAMLACAVSARLPFHRVPVPGAAFVARVAYSVYLSHKLVMHLVGAFFSSRGWAMNSPGVIAVNLLAVTLVGSALFFVVERPFLRLRGRAVVPRRGDVRLSPELSQLEG